MVCSIQLPGLEKFDGAHVKAEAFLFVFPFCGL